MLVSIADATGAVVACVSRVAHVLRAGSTGCITFEMLSDGGGHQ
jgi:uncharacterized protein YerC